MNKIELQANRRHLFFSVAEAARMISHTTERAWRNWEHGIAPVPADVAEKLTDMCAWRSETLDNMERFLIDAGILWYGSDADWSSLDGHDPALWRPHCSIVAELTANYDVTLVAFDATQYDAWLAEHGHKDSEQMRGQWAAYQ